MPVDLWLSGVIERPSYHQPNLQGTEAGLLPWLLASDELLWRRWKHWQETMVARKIIAPIPQIQRSRNVAGFTMLDRSLSAVSAYGDWRGWGSWSAFDYFMDWLVYGLGHRGQPHLPEEKDEYSGSSGRLADPTQSEAVSDSVAEPAPDHLGHTELDPDMQPL